MLKRERFIGGDMRIEVRELAKWGKSRERLCEKLILTQKRGN